MTRPAEEPGTPLERPGNRSPRGMVTLDRIRLTGLLRKPLQMQGFLLVHASSRVSRCCYASWADCGSNAVLWVQRAGWRPEPPPDATGSAGDRQVVVRTGAVA